MPPYIPRMESSTINRDQRDSYRRNIAVVIAIVCGSVVLATISLFIFQWIFQWILQSVSIENEQKWFSRLDKMVSAKMITQPEMQNIFDKIGIPPNVKVKVLCDSHLNAFAWPGGNIIITSKLLEKLNTEEGLAFVLGHELGHIKNRDHLRGLARATTFLLVDSFTGLSQWLPGNLLYSVVDSAYSRGQELAADRAALAQMRSVYGHTKGGDEFFVAIQLEPQIEIHKALWFVSSHPLTEDRLSYFEKQNKDFLSERRTLLRRDVYDQVLCESGCDLTRCQKERSGGPKSHNRKVPFPKV